MIDKLDSCILHEDEITKLQRCLDKMISLTNQFIYNAQNDSFIAQKYGQELVDNVIQARISADNVMKLHKDLPTESEMASL